MHTAVRRAAFVVLVLLLTYAYLYPGSQVMLEGRTDTVLSDGTDVTGAAFIWDGVRNVWETHPSRLFFGTVYSDYTDPERGWAFWVGWFERFTGLALTYLVPVEQVSTGLSAVCMMVSILAFYALGRYLGWQAWLTFALSLAWGFSAYARARAQVHSSFAAVYHIPAIFLAIFLILRGRSWKSVALAAALFLAAAAAPHYYVITAAFLSPLLLVFLYLQPEARENKKRVSLRLAGALLPAACFLAFNLKVPVPPGVKMDVAQAFPQTGKTPTGMVHPFLNTYAARPIDFFTSDLGMPEGPGDINPLKTLLNESVFSTFTSDPATGNTHERTNGIRWLIWGLAIAALVYAFRKRLAASDRRQVFLFAGIALFGFLLSLGPDSVPLSPALLLNKLVSQIRVPSRAGMWVHFGLIMIVGTWLASRSIPRWISRGLLFPGVLAALMVLEYPPFYTTVQMAPVAPAYAELSRDKGECGVGLYFPSVSIANAQVVYYQFLQRMRGTNCYGLNAMANPAHLYAITQMFPPSGQYLEGLTRDLVTPQRLQKLAACIPLSFVSFDQGTPGPIVEQYCRDLGWILTADRLCYSPNKGRPLVKFPGECM